MISTPTESEPPADGTQYSANAPTHQVPSDRSQNGLPTVLTMLALAALGFLQAWAGRNTMNPDGIQYIEVGLNYSRRNWSSAVNAYWSPLYSWIVGTVLYLFRPPSGREFEIVHLTNFAIYLLSLIAFTFFLKEMIRYQGGTADPNVRIPMWICQAFGYSLFLSSSLDLITLSVITPDLAVSAFVYLIAGLLMRIRRGRAQWTSFAALGLVLGLGYLSKSVMFIFALIVILAAFQLARSQRISLLRLAVTVVVFLAISAPFITALSLQKGRLTIGDTGRVAYLANVNNLPSGYVHGVPPNSHLVFKHAPHQIYEKPAAYEFGAVVPGSCPVWYDASYWYDGARLFFVPKNELRALTKNVYRYALILFLHQGTLLAGVFVLFLYIGRARKLAEDISDLWYLVVPAILVLGLYFLILVQDRYIAPFLVILWASLFLGCRVATSPNGAWFKRSVLLGTACALLATVGLRLARDTVKGVPDRNDPERQYSAVKDLQVAEELHKVGIGDGDKVAFLGDSLWVYWAHVDGIRVEAEIPESDVDNFYDADRDTRESVMKAFAATGVKAVVADRFPPDPKTDGWRELGTSGYYVRNLP